MAEINLRIPYEGPTDEGLALVERIAKGTGPISDSDVRSLAAILAATIKLARSQSRIWDAINAAGSLRIE